MPRGWINKTISFKAADPTDSARYKFASALPNCTNDFKTMIDRMMAGNYKSFKELLEASGKIVSHEFTGISEPEAMEEEIDVEVELGQFL